jgi:hypothetical protein
LLRSGAKMRVKIENEKASGVFGMPEGKKKACVALSPTS